MMKKIKDRITLGAISSIIASIPSATSYIIFNKLGLNDYHINYPASIFLNRSRTNTSEGKIVSALVHTITDCSSGVVSTYVLSATGRDNAFMKGAGVGSFYWLTLNGLIYNNLLHIKSKKPYAPIYSWAHHALFGGLCAFAASKLGDDSIFPDTHILDSSQKIPLAGYSGEVVSTLKNGD